MVLVCASTFAHDCPECITMNQKDKTYKRLETLTDQHKAQTTLNASILSAATFVVATKHYEPTLVHKARCGTEFPAPALGIPGLKPAPAQGCALASGSHTKYEITKYIQLIFQRVGEFLPTHYKSCSASTSPKRVVPKTTPPLDGKPIGQSLYRGS